MTMSKWSMPIMVLIVLLVAGVGGCWWETTPAPTSPSASASPPAASEAPSSSPPASSATSSASEATIVSIAAGEVLVMKAGTTTWEEASPGMTLEPGDRIKTGADSNAVITFFEGSTIELEAGTEIAVTELKIVEDTGSTTIKLWQQIGKTRSRVEKLVDPASRYEIETPAGAAVVRGSVGVTEVDEAGNMWQYVEEGEWWLCAQGECLVLGPGETGYVMVGQPPSRQAPPSAPPSLGAVGGGGGGGPSVRWRMWVQTTVNDFGAGTTDNVTVINVGGGDGTVVLTDDPAVCSLDQDNRNYSANMTHSVYGMEYQAQTFRAGKTGNICKVAFYLEKSRQAQPLVVELRNCVATGQGIEPGNIAHTSVVTDNISGAGVYWFSFSTPYTVVAGTDYSLVLYQQGSGGSDKACYKWYEDTDKYANGMVWQSNNGGATWQKGSQGQHDFYFATYVNAHYPSGILESSIHDCGGSASFGAIAWQSAVPSGTEVKFQIATNNDNSTWNFVGPDGASNTYYTTSGTPIWSGHDGDRYIKYKAYLQTTIDLGQTPELKQVWITYR